MNRKIADCGLRIANFGMARVAIRNSQFAIRNPY